MPADRIDRRPFGAPNVPACIPALKMNRLCGFRIVLDMPRQPIRNNTLHAGEAASMSSGTSNPSDEAVAKLAYQLWAERGRPEGTPEEDWFRAQDLLRAGRAVIASSTSP
jgi:hypothetical protein